MAEEILLDTVEKNLAAFSGQVRYRAAIQRISGSDIVPWYGLVPVQSLSSLCCRVQETQKSILTAMFVENTALRQVQEPNCRPGESVLPERIPVGDRLRDDRGKQEYADGSCLFRQSMCQKRSD